jgi:hypothetical protein
MDIRQRYEDADEVLRQLEDNIRARLWTSIPCVVAEDSDGHTVKLQPAIKAVQLMPDGTSKYVDMAPLLDVPVIFAGGGDHFATHPVKKGDEVHASISSRAISAWHQSGGTQPPSSADVHGLSHAVCHPGIRSDPNKLDKYSANSFQVRTRDANSVVDVSQTSVSANRKSTMSMLVDNGMQHDSEKVLINCK